MAILDQLVSPSGGLGPTDLDALLDEIEAAEEEERRRREPTALERLMALLNMTGGDAALGGLGAGGGVGGVGSGGTSTTGSVGPTSGPVRAVNLGGDFDRWTQAYPNAQLPLDALVQVPGGTSFPVHMRPDLAANFMALRRRAGSQDVSLEAGNSYRDLDLQSQLRAQKGALAAPPGGSWHGYGLAIDFSNYDHDWLQRNAERFGLYQPMSHEPWHWQLQTAEGGGFSEGERAPTLLSRPGVRWAAKHPRSDVTEALEPSLLDWADDRQGPLARLVRSRIGGETVPDDAGSVFDRAQASQPSSALSTLASLVGGSSPGDPFREDVGPTVTSPRVHRRTSTARESTLAELRQRLGGFI